MKKRHFQFPDGLLADMLAANLLMAANGSGTNGATGAVPTAAPAGRKWGREDRKQKEMETKLALMLSATQLPVNIIENSFFREFIEYVQPRFSMPHDVSYLEEVSVVYYYCLYQQMQRQQKRPDGCRCG